MPGITATAFRLDTPSFLIDHAVADPLQLKCAGRQLAHNVDQEFEDIETFCNPGGEAPGVAKESFVMSFLQSFGTDGLYNLLKPFESTRQTFALLLDGASPISATNLEFSGELYVPKIPILDAGVRKYSELELDFKIVGAIVSADTAAAAVADGKHS